VPNAPEPVEWLRFLNQLWKDDADSIVTLQEWMGLCLVPDTSLQKILMLIGPRRSGKGTIARLLRTVVGEVNCCGPTMASLGQNFGMMPMLGKTVAIISDARLSGRTDSAVVVERLLSISGEDALTIDVKHREPVTAKLLTRLMILSNELPRLGDSSGALAGRLVILAMNESFYGREDRLLTDKLLEERAGILCWAIEGLKRLRQRGYLIEPESSEPLRQQMEDLTSPAGQFVRERCELGGEFEEPKISLYAAYSAWSLAHGNKPVGSEQFGRDLLAACRSVRSVRPRLDGARLNCYGGIRLLAEVV
jgi:putative DNA primase/helicase